MALLAFSGLNDKAFFKKRLVVLLLDNVPGDSDKY